jgi:hypothetical protein
MTVYPKSPHELWIKVMTGQRFQLFLEENQGCPLVLWESLGVRIKGRKRSWEESQRESQEWDARVPVVEERGTERQEPEPRMEPKGDVDKTGLEHELVPIPSKVVPEGLWWVDITTMSDETLAQLIQTIPQGIQTHLQPWKQPLITLVSRML